MATFLNTRKTKTINALVDSRKAKIDNPYNIFINKSQMIVDYYNQSRIQSTLDEGTKEVWEYFGKDSPIKYNLIQDAIVYGAETFSVDWAPSDFGLSTGELAGEFIILPNTWQPYPNDYLVIKHIDQVMIFKVTNVTIDTLENGANFYKINYSYERDDIDNLNAQVAAKYRMILDNVGTEFKSVIKEDIYFTAENLDSLIIALQNYYIAVFFKEHLQTFVYSQDDRFFYDSYLIEFLKRNYILENLGGGFVAIQHELPLMPTFALEYGHSVFRSIELQDKSKIVNNSVSARLIENPNTIFYYRSRDYYNIEYRRVPYALAIDILDGELLAAIRDNKPHYTGKDKFKNMIVRFYNDADYTEDEFKSIEDIDILDNKDSFYLIPMLIYIMTHSLQEMIKEIKSEYDS